MVDYTTKDTTTGGVGIYVALGVIVAILLYALFAGGGATTTSADPATLLEQPAVTGEVAPATGDGLIVEETAPVVTE